MTNFRGFAVSVPGNGHIRREIPCQDASGVWLSPRPCMIVCDGRGSAKLSHFGAQAAVKAFRSQCAVMEDLLAAVLDSDRWNDDRWLRFCDLMIRAVCEQKLELAEKYNCKEHEFDFTIAFAVFGAKRCGFFQVGDGAITVKNEAGECYTVFSPDKGEFDNQTTFLRPGDELKRSYHACLTAADRVSAIAITSDGPEHLMFELDTMTPGPIFPQMFQDLENGSLHRQDLLDYLTGSRWARDPRGNDDRSIAVLSHFTEEKDMIQVETTSFGGVLLRTPEGNIAVNGGQSLEILEQEYHAGTEPLAGMILTAEHANRSRNAAEFANKYGIPVLMTETTYVQNKDSFDHPVCCFKMEPVRFCGLNLMFYYIRYDSADPVYFILHGETDIGIVPDGHLNAKTAQPLQNCTEIYAGNQLRPLLPEKTSSLQKRLHSISNTPEELDLLFPGFERRKINPYLQKITKKL